jgi:hypothetical protein
MFTVTIKNHYLYYLTIPAYLTNNQNTAQHTRQAMFNLLLPNSDFFVPTAAMYNVCPEGILFEATA